MTKAEWMLVKSTIERLELLTPIAEQKGNMLISGSTMAEIVECLRLLVEQVVAHTEHEKALQEAWKTWRMSVHDYPTRDWAAVFEKLRALMEDP